MLFWYVNKRSKGNYRDNITSMDAAQQNVRYCNTVSTVIISEIQGQDKGKFLSFDRNLPSWEFQDQKAQKKFWASGENRRTDDPPSSNSDALTAMASSVEIQL